mgnify:CR=1 FL=1
MTLTVQSAIDSLSFLNAHLGDKVNIRLAYKMNKLGKLLDNETQFFRETIQKETLECALKDENGNPVISNGNYRLQPEKIEEYNSKLTEILTTEITIEDISFTLDELAPIEISMSELNSFEKFIQE